MVQVGSFDRPPRSDPCRSRKPPLPEGGQFRVVGRRHRRISCCFPFFVFYSKVVPDDEIDLTCACTFARTIKLARLFLTEAQIGSLDRAWAELRYVSQSPVAELKYYPTFMGFVSQDGPEVLARVKRATEPRFIATARPSSRAGRAGAGPARRAGQVLPPRFTAARWPKQKRTS